MPHNEERAELLDFINAAVNRWERASRDDVGELRAVGETMCDLLCEILDDLRRKQKEEEKI